RGRDRHRRSEHSARGCREGTRAPRQEPGGLGQGVPRGPALQLGGGVHQRAHRGGVLARPRGRGWRASMIVEMVTVTLLGNYVVEEIEYVEADMQKIELPSTLESESVD